MVVAKGYKNGKRFDLEVDLIPYGFYLEKSAAAAFRAMYEAARTDGLHLKVNTAFRTMEHQERLRYKYERDFKDYLKAMARWVKGETKDKPKRPLRPARPGYSNHQSGISVDINRAPGDDPKTPEADSPVDKWLQANVAKFGFVFDVPGEPWHVSYLPERAKELTKAP